MSVRVHHLTCGELRPPGGVLVYGSDAPHRHLVCHCLLIEIADRLVLVDSGIGRADMEDPRRRLGSLFLSTVRPRLERRLTAADQLEALGHRPEDVTDVVLTHLDVDHAGGLADFPRARVHVMADEADRALAQRTLQDRVRYRPLQWQHGVDWHRYHADGEPWFGFDCVRSLDELPPQILLVPVVGHSAGHSAVAVQTDRGWLMHCGDAYFHRGEMQQPLRCPPGLELFQRMVAWNLEQRLRNRDRLRQLAHDNDDVEVFSAHDAAELAAMTSSN